MNNIEWLNNNKDHYLYKTWKSVHNFDINWANTCCIVTTERLCKQFSGKKIEDWNCNYDIDLNKSLYCIFWGDDDHSVVIKNNEVHHSYFDEFLYRIDKFTQNQKDGIINGDLELFMNNKKSNDDYGVYQLFP